ncbi:MAG: hypothetical protein QOJ69_1287, partial [Actinomycetota bacterium]|nr:hypothetical protein [Actinomycetota bacterium]
DPLGVGCDGIVDVDVLERVLAKASQSGGSSQSDQ